VRIKISAKKRSLKEDEARNPDRRRSTQNRHQLLGSNRFHQKKQERAQKNRAAKQPSRKNHDNLEVEIARSVRI
jgi:hypothetical protein